MSPLSPCHLRATLALSARSSCSPHDATQDEPETLTYELSQSTEDECAVIIYERYTREAALTEVRYTGQRLPVPRDSRVRASAFRPLHSRVLSRR